MFGELILIALCVAVYLPTVWYFVVVDDIRWLGDVQKGMFEGKKNFLAHFYQRFYSGATFAHPKKCPLCKGNKEIDAINDEKKWIKIPCQQCKGKGSYWDTDLRVEHAFTIAMHALCVVLIYEVLGRNDISFWAAVLWAVNPTNLQTSVWLNGRRYQVNVVLTLAMLGCGYAGILFYIFTPILHATAIFAPVLLGLPGIGIAVALLIATWDRYINPKIQARMKSIVNKDMRVFSMKRLIIIVKTFGFYISRMLWPFRPMMVYSFLTGWGMSDVGNRVAYKLDTHFFIGAASLIAAGIGVFVFPDPQRWYLAFALLGTLQFCNILPAVQVYADRYCILPNVFVMYFVSYLLHMTPWAVPVMAGLAAFYTAETRHGFRMFRDIASWWAYHTFNDPKTPVRKFKINFQMKSGDIMGAWETIKEGLLAQPNDFAMNYQAAICMVQMRDKNGFDRYIKKAEENHYLDQQASWQPQIDEMKAKWKEPPRPRHMSPAEFARSKR